MHDRYASKDIDLRFTFVHSISHSDGSGWRSQRVQLEEIELDWRRKLDLDRRRKLDLDRRRESSKLWQGLTEEIDGKQSVL